MKILIKDATVINEGLNFKGSVLISDDKIEKIFPYAVPGNLDVNSIRVINAKGLYLIPGVIDDHVHFREPGFTHKGDISTESRAAVAGGVTSFMEMPNTNPQTVTRDLLEKKYNRAMEVSLANYSFYIGATNDNLSEILNTEPSNVCGVKVFMGSSTGDMLVNDEKILLEIFKNSPSVVVAHCEDEKTIQNNIKKVRDKYGDNVPFHMHPRIRSTEACFRSSSKAVSLASKLNTRLHILHLSTAREMELFSPGPVKDKNITAEVCVHHLWFDDRDYSSMGSRIKWNPAIKTRKDKEALWEALLNDRIDVIATDHAPHTMEEKDNSYFHASSGGPMVQHSLAAMLEMSRRGIITVAKVVQKMCHAPADLFRVDRRGYIREGYYADLVLINPNENWVVSSDNIMYKCGWSPFEGREFSHKVVSTFVNGREVFNNGEVSFNDKGCRIFFEILKQNG